MKKYWYHEINEENDDEWFDVEDVKELLEKALEHDFGDFQIGAMMGILHLKQELFK